MKYYISKHLLGSTVKRQLTPSQKKAWYKGRYTSDEIKEMQLLLNKTGLYNVEITGEPTDKFLNAVLDYLTKFQKSTGANMLLDGLVGDLTAAAMGLRLNSANRGYTVHGRSGLMRTAQPSERNLKIIDYANKPEMVRFLVTPANTKENKELQKQYIKLYYLYLSPENKRKVYTHWDGWHEELGITKPGEEDAELDAHLKNVQEIAKLYNTKLQGIGNLPDMIASGAIRSGDYYNEDLEKYIKQYNLSPEEAALVLNSEAGRTGALIGMYNHEIGQQNTDAKRAERMEDAVREATTATANTIKNVPLAASEMIWGTAKDIKDGNFNRKNRIEDFGARLFASGFDPKLQPRMFTDFTGSTGNKYADFGLDVIMDPFNLAGGLPNYNKPTTFLKESGKAEIIMPAKATPKMITLGTPKMIELGIKALPEGSTAVPALYTPNLPMKVAGLPVKYSPNLPAVVPKTTTPTASYRIYGVPGSFSKADAFVPVADTHYGQYDDINIGKTPGIKYTQDDVAFSPNPYIPQLQNFVSERGVRPAATTGTEGDAIATYISEINSMRANDPDNPLIQLYEAILKLMGVPSNKKGGCMYKKGKRVK